MALFNVVRNVLKSVPCRDPGQLYTIYENNQDSKSYIFSSTVLESKT